MLDLITALMIFHVYMKKAPTSGGYQLMYPTHCNNETLEVLCNVAPEEMDAEDRLFLESASFTFDRETEVWKSTKYGSS